MEPHRDQDLGDQSVRKNSTLLARERGWPKKQCCWQLLVQCAGPRCNHFVRTVPPSFSALHAEGHDREMQVTMATLLEGIPGDASQQRVASQLATLPMRMGGLGSRSAARIACSILDFMERRTSHDPPASLPDRPLLHSSGGEWRADGCAGELQKACVTLDRSGFVGRPSWAQLRSVERAERVAAWL